MKLYLENIVKVMYCDVENKEFDIKYEVKLDIIIEILMIVDSRLNIVGAD